MGLDLVGEMLVLIRQGQGHLQRQFEGEDLVSQGLRIDFALEVPIL
jgi:hypothetical protein